MQRAWCAGATPTSLVATSIIIYLWTWCNNCKTATMLITIYLFALSFSVYLWIVIYINFVTLVCECQDWLWDMITVQQQTCYCEMLLLNSYIFYCISKPILKCNNVNSTKLCYIYNITYYVILTYPFLLCRSML